MLPVRAFVIYLGGGMKGMGRIPRVEGMLAGRGVYNSKSMGRRQRQANER